MILECTPNVLKIRQLIERNTDKNVDLLRL